MNLAGLSQESNRIYVDLDSLLDLRLGTLYCMNPTYLEQVLNANYLERETDVWSDLGVPVDQAAYERRYAERDVDVLRASRVTNISLMLNQLAASLVEAKPYRPELGRAKIEINTWPFQMSQEVASAFIDGMEITVTAAEEISVVYYAPEQLTPELIDDRWDALIMYDFNHWLTLHSEALKKKRLTTTTFITPTLYRNKKPTDAELQVDSYGKVNAFAALEMMLSELLTLVMIDTRHFSLIELTK